MNNWHPEIEQFLLAQNYEQIVNFYEQLVENNPENVTNYLYLGLAYLLTGKEEEFQSTWLMIFWDCDETTKSNYQKNFLEILEIEINRQETNKNFDLAYSLREKIRAIYSENTHNLLNLILLKLKLNIFNIDDIQQWNLNNLLKNNIDNEIDKKLIF